MKERHILYTLLAEQRTGWCSNGILPVIYHNDAVFGIDVFQDLVAEGIDCPG